MHYFKFCINVKETLYAYSEIPLLKNLFHIEAIQLIGNANQLAGFYMEQGLTKICFWNDCSLKKASFVEQYQLNYLPQVCFWKNDLLFVVKSTWKSAN